MSFPCERLQNEVIIRHQYPCIGNREVTVREMIGTCKVIVDRTAPRYDQNQDCTLTSRMQVENGSGGCRLLAVIRWPPSLTVDWWILLDPIDFCLGDPCTICNQEAFEGCCEM